VSALTDRVVLTSKAWRLHLLAVVAVTQSLALVALAVPIAVPGRAISDVVAPLLPLSMAAVMVTCSRSLVHNVTEVRHRHWHARRITLTFITLTASTVCALLATALQPSLEPLMLIRNAGLFVGFVLLLGDQHPSQSLLLLTAYAMVSWILGSGGMGQPAQPWAVPLLPASDPVALTLTTLVLALGLTRLALQTRRVPDTP
jgi:hypothetical protein